MADAATQIVPVVLSNGVRLHIEARPLGAGGRQEVGILDASPFKDLTDSIEMIASEIGGALKKIAPQKGSVEFGVEVGIESGKLTALICKGSGTANLKITLEWSTPSGKEP
jgi:Trypsin-co-occurring domain 1